MPNDVGIREPFRSRVPQLRAGRQVASSVHPDFRQLQGATSDLSGTSGLRAENKVFLLSRLWGRNGLGVPAILFHLRSGS